MAYKYFNQNNYGSVPYPSTSLPKATVKSGGCGVVCASMIVENLVGDNFDPSASANYSMKKGARVNGGTDMLKLGKCLQEEFGLSYTTTNSVNDVIAHLKTGGMAICNVGGDRSGHIGVFSNSGHFIVVAGIKGSNFIVLDPGYYVGKFNKSGRRQKVTVGPNNELYCSFQNLDDDATRKTHRYHLFSRVKSASNSGLAEKMTVRVKTSLDVRYSARAESSAIAELYNGDHVYVCDYVGNYAKIAHAGYYAFVTAKYLVKYEDPKDNTPDSWATESINWAKESGILLGDSSGNLKLHEQCTRQEMSVFIKRYMDKYWK